MVVTYVPNEVDALEIRVNNAQFEDIVKLHTTLFNHNRQDLNERVYPYRHNPHAIIITAHEPITNKIISYKLATALSNAPHIPIRHEQLLMSTIPAELDKILYLHYSGTSPQYQKKGIWHATTQQIIKTAQEQKYTHITGFFKEDTTAISIKKICGEPIRDFPVEVHGMNYHLLNFSIDPSNSQ